MISTTIKYGKPFALETYLYNVCRCVGSIIISEEAHMKKISVFFIALFFFLLFSPAAYGFTSLQYDSIAYLSQHGGPVSNSILEIIQNKRQLDSFYVKNQFDTSLNSKTPDFDSVTVLALLSVVGGGNSITRRAIQRIVDDIDTIFVEIHRETHVYPGTSLQQAYGITLFSISRTEKPIVLREVTSTAIRKISNNVYKIKTARLLSKGDFNCQGQRLKSGHAPSHCMLILVNEYGNGRTAFVRKGR